MLKQEIRENMFFLTIKLIILEFFFGIIFLFFTTILDFFELSTQDALSNILSLEGLLMLVLIVMQIILTVTVVLHWTYNYKD